MIKNLVILGSTGSIGLQALDIVRKFNINVLALSAKSNINLLENQIREFKPEYAVVFNDEKAYELQSKVRDLSVKILTGLDGLCEIASIKECDIVLNALSGMIGLKPTLSALGSGNDVALANKETLVVGGELVADCAKKNNTKIFPVDSEHCAVFQSLQGCPDKGQIKNLILTASGGPFFGKSQKDLENVMPEQALNHPNWRMGPKISVDSATMMNKGLEIIEAAYLFDIGEDKIKVLIHRESIVHSMVEYTDGSVIAQLAVPDMRIPIQYAFSYPDRLESCANFLNLAGKSLTFHKPEDSLSECMNLCRRAIRMGGSEPVILNAANEEAVRLFLKGKIRFTEISQIVKSAMMSVSKFEITGFDDIINADKATREYVGKIDV